MNVIFVLSLLLGSAGVAGAVASFLKVKPERDSIIVTAAQGAVVIQTKVLDELREELDRVNARADALDAEQQRLSKALEEVTHERDYLRSQNEELHREVEKLRQRVGELERNGG